MTSAVGDDRSRQRGLAPVMIEIVGTAGISTRQTLSETDTIIGRVQDAGIRLDHVMVSRQHAEISRKPSGDVILRDLGSRNGTLVNGKAVSLRVLTSGDEISIGPFVIKIHLPRPEPLPSAPAPATASAPSVKGPSPAPTLPSSAELASAEFEFNPRTVSLPALPVIETPEDRISTLEDVEPPRVSAGHLMRLNEFSQHLLNTSGPSERLESLCRLMANSDFNARWALILRIPDSIDGATEVIGDAIRGANAPSGEPHLSRSVLRAVRKKREAGLAGNFGAANQIEMSVVLGLHQLTQAVIACPIRETAAFLDVLYLILPPQYGSGEWLALTTLAAKQYQQAESAWAARAQAAQHAAIQRELEQARRIQEKLVPRHLKVAGLDIALGFIPCLAVGGDYVDVVPLPDGRTLLIIADVCGKGMAAALVAHGLYTLIHSSIRTGMDFAPMMQHINNCLGDMLQVGSFVTMFAGALDSQLGDLEYVNAGHPPALIIRPGQPARETQFGENMPMGCEQTPLVFQRTPLEAGELLALYTDGLTELGDAAGELLGINGLKGALWALHGTAQTPSSQIATYLTAQLDAIQGDRNPADDRTFLLIRREMPVRNLEPPIAEQTPVIEPEAMPLGLADTNVDGVLLPSE